MHSTSLNYWDLNSSANKPVLGYFLIRLLQKNKLFEEEYKEVHIYIAGLLLKRIHPNHLIESEKYLVNYESDLIEELENSNDLAHQYHFLKFNADYLLVDSGIFLKEEDSKYLSAVNRGKTYYRWTANCAQHIYRKSTPLTDVYEHLSSYFESYQEKLKRLRKVYFNFVKKLDETEKSKLMQTINPLIDPS